MKKNKYQTMNLPGIIVEELKLWKQAYGVARGRSVSYGEMLRELLDNIKTTNPDVASAMDFIMETHPDLKQMIDLNR